MSARQTETNGHDHKGRWAAQGLSRLPCPGKSLHGRSGNRSLAEHGRAAERVRPEAPRRVRLRQAPAAHGHHHPRRDDQSLRRRRSRARVTTTTVGRFAPTPPSQLARPAQKPYTPYGAIETMFYDHSPELIVSGPADTGKSRGILERMYLLASKYPRSRMLMTRKTRASLTESAMVTFERYVVPDHSPVLQGPQREQRHAYRFPNGSEIVTGGLGDDKEKTRIMSTEYDLIY